MVTVRKYYEPKGTYITKDLCASCVVDLTGKDRWEYKLDNRTLMYCSPECLKYYTLGDHNTKVILDGDTLKVYSRQGVRPCEI